MYRFVAFIDQNFITKLFDKCIVLCLSYSIFFYKFIALIINVLIILNRLLSKDFYAMLLSIKIFVTKLFDKCIVLCLSYSIFFDKFIALKINVSIILNKSFSKDFYAMFLTFIEFATIIASLILWV
jgi:hypothetical protein